MTLTLAASPVYLPMPAVRLTASSTASGTSPVPANSLLSVTRTHQDGTVHPVLTDRGPRFSGGTWVWDDYCCPYNQTVTYTVTAAGYTATVLGILPSDVVWLIHPTDPERSVMVEKVSEIGDRSTGSRSTKLVPLNGKAVFLSSDERDGVTGTLQLRVTDEAPCRDLFSDDSVILVNTPGQPGWDLKWLWIQPGNVQYQNPVGGWIHAPFRHVTVPFEESDDPDVDVTPLWTSGDAEAYWTGQGVDSGGLVSRYATSLDLQTDTRV